MYTKSQRKGLDFPSRASTATSAVQKSAAPRPAERSNPSSPPPPPPPPPPVILASSVSGAALTSTAAGRRSGLHSPGVAPIPTQPVTAVTAVSPIRIQSAIAQRWPINVTDDRQQHTPWQCNDRQRKELVVSAYPHSQAVVFEIRRLPTISPSPEEQSAPVTCVDLDGWLGSNWLARGLAVDGYCWLELVWFAGWSWRWGWRRYGPGKKRRSLRRSSFEALVSIPAVGTSRLAGRSCSRC